MRLSRRTFLGTLGATAAGTFALKGMGQSLQESRQLLEEWSNYEEEFHVSICQQCPGGCGVLARVVDGNVVKLTGNPLYPVNEGGLCMKGLAGLQVLHDPDRIQSPLERVGDRGSGQWKPISWEEALKRVADRLRSLRQEGKSHTVAMVGGQYKGLTDGLFQRFWSAYGSPNYLRFRCLAPERATPSVYYMQGLREPVAYDLARSRYILSFGCNLLESWVSTVHQQKVFGRLRHGPAGDQNRLVHVDTRLSVAAAKADQWIPIKPGTDAALALGLAYIIIQEGLYDREFVRDQTFGFEDWEDEKGETHRGFKTLVQEEYSPEIVAGITGVPVEMLFRVARAFARTRPAIAIGERGPSFHANDVYTRMAIHSLNALVGNIGKEGGFVRQGPLPLTPWPRLRLDRSARAGLGHSRLDQPAGWSRMFGNEGLGSVAENIAKGRPYELNALFLYYLNPLYSQPNREDWSTSLKRVPFIVSFSPFMDESTLHADLVLPDSTYLERWRDDQVNYLAGVSMFGIAKPVVPPLFNTRQTEDVMLQIADQVGGVVKRALPWKSYPELLREKVKGLHQAGRGHIVMAPQEEGFESILARQGYWEPEYPEFEEFWENLLKKGAWWDPNDTYVGIRQLIQTPSGKFEFYSQGLRRELRQKAIRAHRGRENALERLAGSIGLQQMGDHLFLPHYEAPGSDPQANRFPYSLNTYKLISHAGGRGANQPWLQQQPAVHVEGGWESWVEINPETAAKEGIGEEDWVWLEAARGRIRVKAKIYPGALPDVLNMPFGQGHRGYGRWARDRGANPNDIIEDRMDTFRGLHIWGSTRVRLKKA